MIIDTDVLIWYLRGNSKAYEVVEENSGFSISAITYMELAQGMCNKQELITLRKAIRNWGTQILYINEEISAKAMFYVEQHYLSESIQLADALIGATSVVAGLPLLTADVRYYKPIRGIQLKQFRP